MKKLLQQILGRAATKEKVQALETEKPAVDLEIYNGLRVEVTTVDDRMLFAATLLGLQADKGILQQTSEAVIQPKEEGLPVKIRGFSNREMKAVYLEGTILPGEKGAWPVAGLSHIKTANDRAFFRQATDAEVNVAQLGRIGAKDEIGRMMNISVGGVCIYVKGRYHVGDKLILKVKIQDNQGEMVIVCEIRRAIEKNDGYEYGCRFVQLSENEQNKIAQSIYEMQRQKRYSKE